MTLFLSWLPLAHSKLDAMAKVKSGTILRMAGPAEVVKTSQALLYKLTLWRLCRSPNHYVNLSQVQWRTQVARTGLKFVTREDGIMVLSLFCQVTVWTPFCDGLQTAYKQIYEDGGHLCCIIDSIDMFILKSNPTKIGENRKPAGVNFMTKEMFRQLCGTKTCSIMGWWLWLPNTAALSRLTSMKRKLRRWWKV